MATAAEIIDGYARQKNYYPHVPYKPVGQTIVDKVKRQGPDGLYLSTACALVEKESGFKNVFGCDYGSGFEDVPPFCNVAVTKERVRAHKHNYYNVPPVGEGANGIGYGQLTSMGYVEQADALGGAHLPGPNLEVSFGVLLGHIQNLGWPAGAAAYNAGANGWRRSSTPTGPTWPGSSASGPRGWRAPPTAPRLRSINSSATSRTPWPWP